MSIDAIVAMLCAGVIAVVGHGMAMWFRMGTIEGKLEMVLRELFRKNGHQDKG